MLIRPLNVSTDLEAIVVFYKRAPDYWTSVDGIAPDRAKARDFFELAPPNCDEGASQHLGLFVEDRLAGIANMFFGFPQQKDAYIGLLLLGPWAREQGYGVIALRHLERLAVHGGALNLCLAVSNKNPRGETFWKREGFLETGLSGASGEGVHRHILHRLKKKL
jgi:GNAT superfamily N-acetyltransferase